MAVYVFQRRVAEYRRGFFEVLAKAVPELYICTDADPEDNVSFHWKSTAWGEDMLKRRRQLGYDDSIAVFGLELFKLRGWMRLVSNRRCIIWGHGFGRSRLSIFARPARVAAARLASASIVYTDRAKSDLCRWVSAERVFVARNTIVLPPAPPPDRSGNHFVFFGDLRKQKRVDDLIEAFRAVSSSSPRLLRLVIVGNGVEREALKRDVEIRGLSHAVSFHPRTTSPEGLGRFLSGAIATVSPGHVGLSVVQSFWAGVPIVTEKRAGHAPEIEYCIPNQNSILYSGGVQGLIDAMTQLLDVGVAAKLGDGARRYYEENLDIGGMVSGFREAVVYAQR